MANTGTCHEAEARAVVIPAVTAEQMREVDRLMIDFGITLVQMMENAGRSLAEQARRMLGGNVVGRRVVVLAGSGGNGGGGLAAARRLAIWGADVDVVLGGVPETLAGALLRQLETLSRLEIRIRGPERWPALEASLRMADLVLDALIGYSLHGSPREPISALIQSANDSGTPLLALDVPSGLDADSGEPFEPTIRATVTLTLALPKVGLLKLMARQWVGDLYLADISVPETIYQRLGLRVGPIFAESDIVRVPTDAANDHP